MVCVTTHFASTSLPSGSLSARDRPHVWVRNPFLCCRSFIRLSAVSVFVSHHHATSTRVASVIPSDAFPWLAPRARARHRCPKIVVHWFTHSLSRQILVFQCTPASPSGRTLFCPRPKACTEIAALVDSKRIMNWWLLQSPVFGTFFKLSRGNRTGLVHGTLGKLHAPTGHDTLWSACASRNAHHTPNNVHGTWSMTQFVQIVA